MKDSGIEWIGKIPENWSVMRLRFLCDISTGNQDTQDNDPNGEYPFYVRSPIVQKSKKYTFEGPAILMAGDGVGAGRVFHYVDGKYGCHQRVYSIHNIHGINRRFLFYYLQNMFYVEIETANSKSTVDSVRLSMLQDFVIPMAPAEEQEKIAKYLDAQCMEIDNILIKSRASIKAYKSMRQSVITLAVTQGIKAERKMKNTGIAWIGLIPEDWDSIKLKYASQLKGRIGWQGLTSDEYQDEGAFLITGVNFNNGVIDWNSCVHISEERFEEAPDIHIKEDDLLITKDGTIGKVAIAKECPEKVSLNSGVMLIRNEREQKYYDKFLYYTLLSDEFWIWYNLSQTGNSTIKHLYQEQFYNFEFAYPSLEEQQEIAQYLDSKISEIDKLIFKKEAFINEIETYKKALIYECVTGKRKVL